MQLVGNTDTMLYNNALDTSIKLCVKKILAGGFSDMASPMGKLFQTACTLGKKSSN